MPSDPHITLAFPFIEAADVTDAVLGTLRERVSSCPPFEFALASSVRFGEVVFLSPEPAEPFRALVRALGAGNPPYVMPVTDIWAHVTVASSPDGAALDRVEALLSPEFPIVCRARTVELRVEANGSEGKGNGNGWPTLATFYLAG
jgi:2'-5' RNA ligase